MDDRLHYFHIELAEVYGVKEAIMLNNIIYWIATNRAKNKNYIGGRTWTFSPIVDFKNYFTYWTDAQIRTVISNLVKKEVLIVDNFNKVKYDRTKWYALKHEEYFLKNFNPIDKTDKWNNKF